MSTDAVRTALDDPIDAMEYHIEQTRPIELSTVALTAARAALAQEAQPAALSDDELKRAIYKPLDDLLNHIYEHGTAAEGVMARCMILARAIERAVREQST